MSRLSTPNNGAVSGIGGRCTTGQHTGCLFVGTCRCSCHRPSDNRTPPGSGSQEDGRG